MRLNRNLGIANGVVLILVILVIAVPSTVYLAYFNKPITTATVTSTNTSSGSSGTSGTTTTTTTTSAAGPEQGFVTGGISCGFGLTFGSPGGEGCIIYMLNNSTSTETPTGQCNLTFGGNTYAGTFSYADAMSPGTSTGKVTCGSSAESPPAGAGTVVSGEIFLSNGAYVPYNSTAKS